MYTFEITPDNGTAFRVTANMRDVLKWERGGLGRSAQELTMKTRLTDLYVIAHIAATRQEKFVGTLGEMENTCDVMTVMATVEIDGDGGEDSTDPTQPDR